MLEIYEVPSESNPVEYMCFNVALNLSWPFLQGLTVKFEDERLWLSFSYESLSMIYYNCGRVGHFFKACPSFDRDSKASLVYDASIKAKMS